VVATRRCRGLFQDLLGGTVVLLAWILLWSFFAVAVVEPAARLRAGAAALPGAAGPAVAGSQL
jgi:hypothetical protein